MCSSAPPARGLALHPPHLNQLLATPTSLARRSAGVGVCVDPWKYDGESAAQIDRPRLARMVPGDKPFAMLTFGGCRH